MSLPSASELKGTWNQHVGTARIAWGKLGEAELLRSEGHRQRLSGLVQERYGITRDEAERQVQRFLEQCSL